MTYGTNENLVNKPINEDIIECIDRLRKGVNRALANHSKRADSLYNQGEIDATAKEQIDEEIDSIRSTVNTVLEMFENCNITSNKQMEEYEKSVNNVISNMIMGLAELVSLRLENGRNQEI